MEKKLAVIFPGVGYTCAKPLLYYSSATAVEMGYELIQLDYGADIHSFKGRSPHNLDSIADVALNRITPILSEIDFSCYKKVVFISKSIGTVIACRAQKKFCGNTPVLHFLLTPIPSTLPYLKQIEGLFFSGTADPYISSDLICAAAENYPNKTGKIYHNCNHSLEEKGKTLENIHILSEIMHILRTFL